MTVTRNVIDVRFEVFGEQQIVRSLTRRSIGALNLRPVWEKIADVFAAAERVHFASKGMGRWKPLSPAYARWKAWNYPGQPIMVRTGALREQLTQRPFGVEQMSADRARFGTNLPYAAYHQLGGWVSGQPPRRKVISLTESTKREITKIVQRELVEADRREFGTPAWAPPEAGYPNP